MKKIYQQYKLIIWPLASGLASIIILALVIVPQFLSYLQTREQITKTQNHSSKLEAKAAELEGFDQGQTQKNLETAFTVLPADADVPKSLAILQGLIRASALELKNTSFTASRKSGSKPSFQLNITVAGPISLIREFLINLKNSPQIFQVESINIRFAGIGSAVEATIPITVFYEVSSKILTETDQPLSKLSKDEEELLQKLSKATLGFESSSGAAARSVPLGKLDPFE